MRPILCIIGFAACLATGACRETPASLGPRGALASLHAHLQQEYGAQSEFLDDPHYAAALIDLDGDGREEAVAYIQSRHFCGTGGCGIEVFARSGAGWREVAKTSIAWPPIRVLESRSRGWRDLAVGVAGGGIIPGYEALLAYDGRTYPNNPSMPPARALRPGTPGRVLIPREPRWRPLLDQQPAVPAFGTR